MAFTIEEIFNLAIEIGKKNDPRGRAKVEKILKKIKKDYGNLSSDEKKEFDKDRFTNPYSDSGIHFGDPKKKVKRVLVGIDMDPGEILLAKELERQGKPIDLIIGHHPIGKSYARLHEVMDIQIDVLVRDGIPENIAEKIMEERIKRVSQGVAPANHFQSVDTAKILNVPIMNIHTPADNCVWNFINDYIDSNKYDNVGSLVDSLKKIPEYKIAANRNAGPIIFSGDKNSRTGKITIGMTGGTEGSEKIYERMSHYGIGTIVDMHLGEEHLKEASKNYINVVVAGHIASDSLGLNIIMDELEKRGVEIIPCSGYIRYSRKKA